MYPVSARSQRRSGAYSLGERFSQAEFDFRCWSSCCVCQTRLDPVAGTEGDDHDVLPRVVTLAAMAGFTEKPTSTHSRPARRPVQNPVRVVAFNTTENGRRMSRQVAYELRRRCISKIVDVPFSCRFVVPIQGLHHEFKTTAADCVLYAKDRVLVMDVMESPKLANVDRLLCFGSAVLASPSVAKVRLEDENALLDIS